jgi:hypothetical protein
MIRPFAPAYNGTFKLTAGAAGNPVQDLGLPDMTARTFRVFNSGAGQIEFAFQPDNTTLVADKGVQLKAGDAIFVTTSPDQRYFAMRAGAAYTVYVTPGMGGTN